MKKLDANVEKIKPRTVRDICDESDDANEATNATEVTRVSGADNDMGAVEVSREGDPLGHDAAERTNSARQSKYRAFAIGLVSGVVLVLCLGAVPFYLSMVSARSTEAALASSQDALVEAKLALAQVQVALRDEQAMRKSLEINIAQSKLDALSAQLADINIKEKEFQQLLATKSIVLSKKRDSEKRVDALTEELMKISNGH